MGGGPMTLSVIMLFTLLQESTMATIGEASPGNIPSAGNESLMIHPVYSDGVLRVGAKGESCSVSSPVQGLILNVSQELRVDLYGPVRVSCHGETIWIQTNPVCDSTAGLVVPIQGMCHLTQHSLFWALVGASILLTYLLLICLKYIHVRYVWTPTDHILVSSRGKLSDFTQRYAEGRVTPLLNKYQGQFKPKEVDEATACYKTYRFKGVRLAFLILSLVLTPNSMFTEARVQKLILSEGDVVHVKGVRIEVVSAHLSCPLIELYRTAPWTTTMESNYWCTWSSCDWDGPCTEFSPLGNWTRGKLMPTKDSDQLLKATKRYCSPTGPNCPFILGCWKWEVHIKADMSRSFVANALGECRPIVRVVASGEGPTRLVDGYLMMEGPGEKVTILTSDKRPPLYCNQPHNKGFPEANKLGDLQILANGAFALSEDSIVCRENPDWGPKCLIADSPLISTDLGCRPLELTDGNKNIRINGGVIELTEELSLRVLIESDESDFVSLEKGSCKEIKRRLFGSHNSGVPFVLEIHTDPATMGNVELQPDGCLPEGVLLDCSHRTHHIEVSSTHFCLRSNSTGESFVTESMVATTTHNSILAGDDTKGYFGSFLSLSRTSSVVGWLIGHGVGNLVLIGIVVVAFLRR